MVARVAVQVVQVTPVTQALRVTQVITVRVVLVAPEALVVTLVAVAEEETVFLHSPEALLVQQVILAVQQETQDQAVLYPGALALVVPAVLEEALLVALVALVGKVNLCSSQNLPLEARRGDSQL